MIIIILMLILIIVMIIIILTNNDVNNKYYKNNCNFYPARYQFHRGPSNLARIHLLNQFQIKHFHSNYKCSYLPKVL